MASIRSTRKKKPSPTEGHVKQSLPAVKQSVVCENDIDAIPATKDAVVDQEKNADKDPIASLESPVELQNLQQELSDEAPHFESAEADDQVISSKATAALSKAPKATRDESVSSLESGNELTKLIPGYVAPLKLDTSSLDRYRPSGGLAELCRRAEQTDASTSGFVLNAAETHARAMKKTSNGFMPTTYASLYSSFKQGIKHAPDNSAGKGWFGMVPTPMTEELKTDLSVIRNRNYLDPKRFYKSADKTKNNIIQLGTVIEGSAEFYSSRLTKKQRRSNLTEEIMADPATADYTKNKYKAMQQKKSEKGRNYYKKKLSKRARRGY